MKTFDFEFKIAAPVEAVSAFHHDTSVLKKLTPPPIFVQLHDYEPLGEGSRADFTMWFGPLPVRWTAVHSQVSQHGFTDTQERGPLRRWQHRHQFEALGPEETLVSEHIEYEYAGGWRGIIGRLLFNRPGLMLLFEARKWLTRWHIRRETSRMAYSA